jgi:membrane associated rhomboid family serine protease
MIVPWLRGFLSHQQAPITWAIIIMNIFIFMSVGDRQASEVHEFFSKNNRFEMTAKLYYQYKFGKHELPPEQELAVLGAQALRDVHFIQNAEKLHFHGDELAIKEWKMEIAQLRESLENRSTSVFGLRSDTRAPLTLITYQFMHAGFVHLLSNMLMLLIFAAALEKLAGSFLVLAVYLFGGAAGALGFIWLGETSLAPMVGASGSLSAIMAFYALAERRKRISFFYFLSPIEGYYGWLWLPTWMIFPLSFISDFAAYLGTAAEIGSGVAYTAHIGGMIFGVLFGFAYRQIILSAQIRVA